MLKSYKYRIYPNKMQEKHLIQAMGCCRFIYNKALETKIAVYKRTKKYLSRFDLCKNMLIDEKEKYIWLKEPNAQSLQSSVYNLDNAFMRFFKEKKGFPKFKKKSGRQSISYPQSVKIDFKTNKLILPKIKKVKCVFDRHFIGKIKTCTISKTPTNKFYVSILVDDGKELPVKVSIEETTTIGIDLGLKYFLTTSNGEVVENPKYLQELEPRLKILQKRASRKKKGSNNRKKANLKVAKLHEVIFNKRKDFLHKLSTKIIRENQSICLEDLNIAGMLKNHCLAKSISSVAWNEFTRQCNYKADWQGKNIITIGRFDPSSKMDHKSGKINKNLKLSDRIIYHEDGTQTNRDLNAAINIKNFGLERVEIYKQDKISGKGIPVGLSELPSSN